MEYLIIKNDSAEWDNMWDILSTHPINVDYPEPSVVLHDGETWQYMGSFKQGNRIIHSFRHRKHPMFERVENISFNGSNNISDNDIEIKKLVR